MKFSWFMMPLHRPGDNPSLAFARDIGLIEYADALGFDEFMIGEHHSGGWETMPAPEMALAMAAAKAPRIRLGTSVTLLPYHHPFQVAERMAFLDHLTRGRAMLGVGPSTLISDKRLFAMGDDRLYPMLHEAVDVIVRLLESDRPVSHDGRFWRFENMRLQLRSYQSPRLPLAIATSGTPETIDLAARHGMMLLSSAGLKRGKGSLADHWTAMEAGAARHGTAVSRDNWRIVTGMYLADTAEQAWAEASDGILREAEYFSTIGLGFLYQSRPDQPFAEFTAASCVERREWIVGTPDDAIRWIETKLRETGGFGGVMLIAHEWAAPEKIRRSMELFARYVMPHFRGHTAVMHDEWSRLRAAPATSPRVEGSGPGNLARKE